MALREDPGGEIVARSEMPREWIASQPTCQSFVFDPIPNSAGKHYTITLRAVNNDLAATIFVLGEKGDPYPDGSAWFASQNIDADAAFRYGCMRPAQ